MGEDTIKIDTANIKKVFNNRYTILFSVLFFAVILILVFKSANILQGISFIARLSATFSAEILLLAAVAALGSAALAHYRKFEWMFLPILVWLLLTTTVIRTANISQLKDVTTGDWTLGPDLDPFLYLRHAGEIISGTLKNPDMMRAAPVGGQNYALTNMMPWVIVLIFKISGIFGNDSLTYAAIIAPVIFTVLASAFFFLFIYVLLGFKFSKKKSALGATIATAFYVFSVQMLHRTVAGIPEIESLGMVWFWLAFLFFTLAWKQENQKKMILFGLLAGLFTGLMSWTWGGYRYIYMILSLSTLLAFVFGVEPRKSIRVFVSWALPALAIELLKVKNPLALLTGFNDTGFALGVLFIMFITYILKKPNVSRKIERFNLPPQITAAIILAVLALVVLSIKNPSFIPDFISQLYETFLKPFGRRRVDLTVAENAVPYITEAIQNFGALFWLFMLGSVVAFYEATKNFRIKIKIGLNFFFILFLASFTFSRISPTHLLNGDNFISKLLYFGGLILFAVVSLYTYLKAYRSKDEATLNDFRNIGFIYFVMLAFSFFGVFSIRGAIRFFFLMAPMFILLSTYFLMEFSRYVLKSRDSLSRLFLWLFFIIAIAALLNTFAMQAISTKQAAESSVPSSYNQQWQKAMAWVREDTPKDSIFVHWWDYGYWVQTIGERPTVVDGGHPAGYNWNHLVGRYVLTTPKPETALSFMKTHNVSYLLIDSTDLGKYSAYSKIGSDADGEDRFSQIPVMVLDPSQTSETSGKQIYVYQGTTFVDGDIVYNDGNASIFLPANRAFVIGLILETSKTGNTLSFGQPIAVFFYNGQQYRIPVRYLYFNGKINDFGRGIEATIRMMQSVSTSGQQLSMDQIGAAIYLSPKVAKGLFAQIYLMDDPLKEYPTLSVAHDEADPLVANLRANGLNVDDIIYFQGFRGPIKIWKVDYPDNIITHKEFLYQLENDRDNIWAYLDNFNFTK